VSLCRPEKLGRGRKMAARVLLSHWMLITKAYQLCSEHNLELVLLARTLVGLVLIAASVPKLTSPGKFVEIVKEYQLLPEKVARVAGRILPLLELAAGLGLVSGSFMPWPSLVAILLFVLFIAAISGNLLRGRSPLHSLWLLRYRPRGSPELEWCAAECHARRPCAFVEGFVALRRMSPTAGVRFKPYSDSSN